MPHNHAIDPELHYKKLKQSKLEKSAAYVAISLTIVMLLLKVYGWFITDSLSILSSLTDSLMDLLVSGINLFAIYYALKPADSDHRYGHTAIEDIAGLLQASMLVGTSLLITIEAVTRFINPVAAPPATQEGLNIMMICLGLTALIVVYQRFVILRSNSVIIKADNLHYLSDLLTNFAVIASLFLWDYFSLDFIDPLLSIIIVAIIMQGALEIGKQSYNNLMDTEMSDEDRDKIMETINAQPGHAGFHDLRTRRSGRKVFIQLHLELDNSLSLNDAHEIADNVERKLADLYEDADVIVHEDPVQRKITGT